MTKVITSKEIKEKVIELFTQANFHLEPSAENCYKKISEDKDESVQGQNIAKQLLENSSIASQEVLPLCQDTGFAIVFIEIGHEVKIEGDFIVDTINEAVKEVYEKKFLRKSIVDFPITKRINTKTNTPAMIHISHVAGNKLTITVMPKGGGSENGSALFMLKPSQGKKGLIESVTNHIKKLGAGLCPPVIAGIGIGGTADKALFLSKKSLCKPVGLRNPDPEIAELELSLLDSINKTGVGPSGLGGRNTALDVHIETFPTHIACLPVGLAIMCNSVRWQTAVL